MNKVLLLAAIIIASFTDTRAQQSANLYDWFDNTVGKENSALHNGPVYFNLFKTRDATEHPFLDNDAYVKGAVVFDGQPYYNVDLKYDINKDALILQPYESGYYKAIELVASRTPEFHLQNRHFVNLGSTDSIADFIKGYYEERVVGNGFTFYIKHHKTSKEFIDNVSLLTSFKHHQDYVVLQGRSFHRINSKNSIIKLFPAYKKQINDFYSKSNRGTDEALFMERVFNHLKTLGN